VGEVYHLFNRGARASNLFRDERDFARFLFLALYSQGPVSIQNTRRFITPHAVASGFRVPMQFEREVIETRTVELVAFCVMPHYFHLLVGEREAGGISAYMQRLEMGYTKYFNLRYAMQGHAFEGRFKSVPVKTEDELLYLSAHIHRNPRDLPKWKGLEQAYPYSSLQDLAGVNRWGGLLSGERITGQFEGTKASNYRDFVNAASGKIIEEQVSEDSLALA
jgi:hypothetical protein